MKVLSLVTTFFLIAVIPNLCFSQDLDSLWKIYNNKSQPDTQRIKAIQDIAWSYVYDYPDSSILFAEIQLKLSRETKQKKFEARAVGILGKANSNKGNYSKALDYYFKSLKLREEVGDKKGIANCYTNMGIVYIEQSNYPKALENYLKSLKIWEELNDKTGMGDCYTNIGNVYEEQFNYSKAIEYYSKDLKISLEQGNEESVAICYNNLGNSYYNQKNYQKAVEYYLKAIKFFQSSNNKPALASCYNNIGSIYNQLNDYDKSLDFQVKSLEIKREIEDIQGMANCYINLSDLYLSLKDYEKAKKYSDSTLIISKQIGDIDNERLSYQNLAEINAYNGQYKAAYEYHKKFKALTDTIFNTENSRNLSDLKTQFEVEKKEAELKSEQEKKDVLANAEKKRQRLILLSVSIFGILVFILAMVIFRNLRINKKKNRIITLQKQMVEHQKHIVEEHQKEILDSIHYAKRIQTGLLAHHDFLKENITENFIFFNPKDIVSGDFYWAAKQGRKFYLAVCDSTGHGVPGAFMSLLNIGFLSEAINEKDIFKPNEVFDYVRSKLITTISKEGQKDGFDGILLCIDKANGEITYASANNAPILIQNRQLTELDSDRMPVGIGERKENFTLYTIKAEPGDVLYLYTDGYADQFGGPKGKKFKYKQLNELLITNHTKPMAEQLMELKKEFENWKGNLEQVDDVTVIGIKV